jgi:hypothetical protein
MWQQLWLKVVVQKRSQTKMSTGGYHLCEPVDGSRCHRKIYKKCTLRASCREYRCRCHCWCARNGTLSGRNCGRTRGAILPAAKAQAKVAAKAKPQAKPKPQPQPKPAPRRSSSPQVSQVRIYSHMSSENWLDALARDVPKAKEMILCSYAYDDPQLHQVLLQELADGLELKVVVDDRYLKSSGAPYYSRSRLTRLSKAGAQVKVGGTASSNMHCKLAVLSGANSFLVCYQGGANATKASRHSMECVTRFLSPPLVEEFRRISLDCFEKARPS